MAQVLSPLIVVFWKGLFSRFHLVVSAVLLVSSVKKLATPFLKLQPPYSTPRDMCGRLCGMIMRGDKVPSMRYRTGKIVP